MNNPEGDLEIFTMNPDGTALGSGKEQVSTSNGTHGYGAGIASRPGKDGDHDQ